MSLFTKRNPFICFLLLLTTQLNAQYFEGKLQYQNFYLDRQTFKPMFDAKTETVFIKEDLQKNDMEGTSEGELDWEIFNYKTGEHFALRAHKDAPIIRSQVCSGSQDTSLKYIQLDTTYIIAGLTSHVLVEFRGGIRMAEYYYCKEIKVKPSHYACFRVDGLDNFYKQTGGALITQMYLSAQGYIYYTKLQAIQQVKVPDTEFELPKELKVVPAGN